MPPKRKQPDDSAAEAATSTRSTRGSTRSSTTKNTAKETASSSGATTQKSTGRGAGKAATAKSSAVDGNTTDGEGSTRSAKKAKASTSTSTRKNATKGSTKAGTKVDDNPTPIRKNSSTKACYFLSSQLVFAPQPDGPRQEIPFKHVASNHQSVVVVEPTPNPPPAPAKKTNTKHEPYTSQRAMELFKKYADSDNADVIGPEGFEQLCTDANMPLDGPRPIIFAWQMGAKDMAKVTKEEWVTGTSKLKVSSVPQISLAVTELDELLIYGKTPVKASAKNQEYDRASYFSYSTNVKAGFQKLYSYAFTLAKPEASRNIDMETSVAFWTVLLVPKYPIMREIIEFINEKGSYKATNKDLWTMMLEFCENVTPNLQGYDPDAAWPTLLDDFVAWKKAASGNGQAATMNVE